MADKLYESTGQLTRFVWRLQRVRLIAWIVSIVAVTLIISVAYPSLYATPEERQAIAETMRNPAMIAMVGPAYGIDNYTVGAMIGHQMLLFTAMAVAIMSILLVTRSTRGDEEQGRIEMIRSLPVGRLSSLAATLAVITIANVVLALLTGLGLAALGIETMDFNGSMLYGAALGVTGIVFAAFTALFAQLTETSRGTLGYAFGFFGLTYLLRAIGDIGTEWLSLISPLGLILRTEVYVNNLWWPIVVTLVIAGAVTWIALYLNSVRDLEAGFIAARPGRQHASRFLSSPLGLAFRLQRTTFISWAIGMFILGASYGSVFGDLEAFFESAEIIRQMLGPAGDLSLTEQFASMIVVVMAMIGAIPALMMILKLKSEETAQRTEHILARAVSRPALIGSYIFIAIISAIIMPVLGGLGLGVAASSVMDEPIAMSSIVLASLAHVPAIFVLLGVATVSVGLAPQTTSISWLYLTFSFFVVYIGGLLQIPEWVINLSPFGHSPQLPVDPFSVGPLTMMILIAAVLIAIGVIGYRRRDVYG